MVWARAWSIENSDWNFRTTFFNVTKHLNVIQEGVQTIIWWQMGDMAYDLMKCFETMVKLVTRASRLKSDNYQFRNDPINRHYCDLCQAHALDDVEHIIHALTEIRNEMFTELNVIEAMYGLEVLLPTENNLHFRRVHQMYACVLKNREGVG